MMRLPLRLSARVKRARADDCAPSIAGSGGAQERHLDLRGLFLWHTEEETGGLGDLLARGRVDTCRGFEATAAVAGDLGGDDNLLADRQRAAVSHLHADRHGPSASGVHGPAHRFVERGSGDATVGDAGESLVRLPRPEASDRADAFDLELDLEALAIAVAAAEAPVSRTPVELLFQHARIRFPKSA